MQMVIKNKTIDYYDNNVDEYVNKSHGLNMNAHLDSFLERLPKYPNILEIGTGSGRDAIYLANKGCTVVTLEPSIGLTEKSRILIDKEANNPQLVTVINSSIQEFNPTEKYDGVYALASLLHLPKSEIKESLVKCLDSLNEGGVMFASFKQGNGESFDEMGRFFSYYEKSEIESILKDILKNEDFNVSVDNKDVLGRSVSWLNIEINKPVLDLDLKVSSFKLK